MDSTLQTDIAELITSGYNRYPEYPDRYLAWGLAWREIVDDLGQGRDFDDFLLEFDQRIDSGEGTVAGIAGWLREFQYEAINVAESHYKHFGPADPAIRLAAQLLRDIRKHAPHECIDTLDDRPHDFAEVVRRSPGWDYRFTAEFVDILTEADTENLTTMESIISDLYIWKQIIHLSSEGRTSPGDLVDRLEADTDLHTWRDELITDIRRYAGPLKGYFERSADTIMKMTPRLAFTG